MAWVRLDGMTAEDLRADPPPVDGYSLERILPYPDQWLRVLSCAARLHGVVTPTEPAALRG